MPKCFTEGDEATLLLLKVRSCNFWLGGIQPGGGGGETESFPLNMKIQNMKILTNGFFCLSKTGNEKTK